MKRQIRNSVFETNSSSTHAIAINRKITRKGYPKSLHFGLFDETDFFTYVGSLEDKADFLYTEILCAFYSDIDAVENWKQKIVEYLAEEGVTDVEFERYYTIKNSEGNKEVDTDNMDLNINWASVSSEFVTTILSDKQTLFEYLFGDDSCVILGRDLSNYDEIINELAKGSYILPERYNKWK